MHYHVHTPYNLFSKEMFHLVYVWVVITLRINLMKYGEGFLKQLTADANIVGNILDIV